MDTLMQIIGEYSMWLLGVVLVVVVFEILHPRAIGHFLRNFRKPEESESQRNIRLRYGRRNHR